MLALEALINDLRAKHKFIKPYCPWQNGKVERFNRTLQEEWIYHQAFDSNQQRTTRLRRGSSSTTLDDATARSEADHRSAA